MKTNTKRTAKAKSQQLDYSSIEATLRSFYTILQGGANFNRETASGIMVHNETGGGWGKRKFAVSFWQPIAVPFMASEKVRKLIQAAQATIRKENEKTIRSLLCDAGFKASVCRDGGVNITE